MASLRKLCSEEFDLSPKLVPIKIVSLKHDVYLIQLDSTLNKFWINALRDAIIMEYVILMLDHYYLIIQKFASSYHYKLPRSMSCPSKVYRSKYNMFMEYGVSKGIYPKFILGLNLVELGKHHA